MRSHEGNYNNRTDQDDESGQSSDIAPGSWPITPDTVYKSLGSLHDRTGNPDAARPIGAALVAATMRLSHLSTTNETPDRSGDSDEVE